MKCEKCNKEFKGYPATSRIDNSKICPECGQREALEAAVNAGMMTQQDADDVLDKLKEVNR